MPASRSEITLKIIDDGIMNAGFTTMIKLAGYIMLFSIAADFAGHLPLPRNRTVRLRYRAAGNYEWNLYCPGYRMAEAIEIGYLVCHGNGFSLAVSGICCDSIHAGKTTEQHTQSYVNLLIIKCHCWQHFYSCSGFGMQTPP